MKDKYKQVNECTKEELIAEIKLMKTFHKINVLFTILTTTVILLVIGFKIGGC